MAREIPTKQYYAILNIAIQHATFIDDLSLRKLIFHSKLLVYQRLYSPVTKPHMENLAEKQRNPKEQSDDDESPENLANVWRLMSKNM